MARKEPLRSFRFLVEVEGDGKKIVAAFSQFSGVKMRVDLVPVRSGAEHRGVQDGLPALTNFENVTLTKGVIGDNQFLDWVLAVGAGPTEAPTGKNKARTINVVALGDKGERAVTWSLLGAMPVAYELGAMVSMQSALLTETIEFTIAGFKREALAT